MEIEKIDKVVIPNFLDYFKDEFKNERERELLLNLLKDCNNKKSYIYLLKDKDQGIGCIGITFDRIIDSPVLSIEYLFVAKTYRKQKIINDKKVSEFLLSFLLDDIIPKLKEYSPIRYLALYPDRQSEKLIKYYLEILTNSFKIKDKKEIWILLKV